MVMPLYGRRIDRCPDPPFTALWFRARSLLATSTIFQDAVLADARSVAYLLPLPSPYLILEKVVRKKVYVVSQ